MIRAAAPISATMDAGIPVLERISLPGGRRRGGLSSCGLCGDAVATMEVGATAGAGAREDSLSGRRSVLVVEDEYFLQADLEKALTDAGFAVESVASGEDALALLIGGNTTYAALVTDVRLRGTLTGWDVARRIRERDPLFPVVYVTGSSAEEWASQRVPNSILVSKPLGAARLVAAVATLLNHRTPPTV